MLLDDIKLSEKASVMYIFLLTHLHTMVAIFICGDGDGEER